MSEAPPDELGDELAAALGRQARQRDAALLDARAPEWEAVAHAQMSVDEASEQHRGDADGELVDRAAAYFRPFDVGETSKLVDGLLAGLDAPDLTSEPEPEPEPELEPESDEVIPLLGSEPRPEPKTTPHDPGSSGFWWIPGGMLAAAAAAIVMWWVWPPSDEVRGIGDEGPTLAQRDPLPSYMLETDGGLKVLRGDTGGESDTGGQSPARHRYRPDTPFEWVLRPKLAVTGEVGVRGFAFVDGGSAGLPLALTELAQVADSGAIRISGKIAALDLEPGAYTIALVVGAPELLPERAEDVASGDSQSPEEHKWEVRHVDILIED